MAVLVSGSFQFRLTLSHPDCGSNSTFQINQVGLQFSQKRRIE